MRKIIFLVICMTLLISACAPAAAPTESPADSQPVPTNSNICEITYRVVVNGFPGWADYTEYLKVEAKWIPDTASGWYNLKPQQDSKLGTKVFGLKAVVEKFNQGLNAIFPNHGATKYASFTTPYIPETIEAKTAPECNSPDYIYETAEANFNAGALIGLWSIDNGFSVSTNLFGDQLGVLITSPSGSVVSYSVSEPLLKSLYDYSFGETENFVIAKPVFRSPVADSPEQTLANLLNADGRGIEAVTFTFVPMTNVLEKSEVKAILSFALHFEAATTGNPVYAVIHATTIDGRRILAFIESDGQSFTLSNLAVNSGKGYEFDPAAKIWFEDLHSGSLYILSHE